MLRPRPSVGITGVVAGSDIGVVIYGVAPRWPSPSPPQNRSARAAAPHHGKPAIRPA